MLRILLISPYKGIQGGISRWTEHIMNFYNSSCYAKDLQLQLLPVQRSKFITRKSIFNRLIYGIFDYSRIIHNFKKEVNLHKFDLVHIASSASISLLKDLHIIKYAKKHNLKTIIHFHFGRIPELIRKDNWESKLLKKVVSLADIVIVMDRLSFITIENCGYKNIVFLPNPVAPQISEIVSRNFDIVREPGKILFVGHVVRTKGIFELMDSFKRLNNKNLILRIIGHIEPEVKKTISGEIGNYNIEIFGEKPYEEIIKDMMSCDIFVLPTYTEGFPNVILESMACECAIISTKVGAIPEMLEEDRFGKYGLLIEPKNTNQLFDAIRKMLADSKLKKQCGENCKRRVYERYSIDVVWNQLLSIWQNCIITSK